MGAKAFLGLAVRTASLAAVGEVKRFTWGIFINTKNKHVDGLISLPTCQDGIMEFEAALTDLGAFTTELAHGRAGILT